MFNFTKTQKQIILGVKIVVLGLLGWFFLYQLFYSEISLLFIILTIVSLALWGVGICIGTLVLAKKFLYPSFALSLLSFFIFFRGADIGPGDFRVAMYYFLIMVLVFITYLIFRSRVLRDKKTRLKLHFWRIFTKKGLAWVFTALCLLIAFAYYFSPSLGEFSSSVKFEIPKSLIDKILGLAGGFGKEAQDFVYEFINSQLRQTAEPLIKPYIPAALAVGLFLALRAAVIFLVPLIVLLGSLSMKLSIALGFVKIITKKAEAEDIEI